MSVPTTAALQPEVVVTSQPRASFTPFAFFFFFSGFCSLLYEVIWLRLGMASFGVTTPIVSLFLSIFMAGLGLGSWAAGRWMRNSSQFNAKTFTPLRLYGLCEFIIGVSALLVPLQLIAARNFIEHYGSDLAVAPMHYFALAGLWMIVILLPWATCMGATFPLAMAAIRRIDPAEHSSFSFLYLANVMGAVIGSLIPAFFLIEIFGFHNTLKIGVIANFAVAAVALALSVRSAPPAEFAPSSQVAAALDSAAPRRNLLLLFLTGFASLAMEVIWFRQFTPYMGNEVYTFAWILGCYLLGTYLGSLAYRRWLRRGHASGEITPAWLLLGLAALLPLLFADPRIATLLAMRFPDIHLLALVRVALAVMPFTGLLGFVTPQLVDQYSLGDPDRAGRAYAINVLGCILGPLVSGFALLPLIGERWSLVLLAAPLLALLFVFKIPARAGSKLHYDWRFYSEFAALALVLVFATQDYIRFYHPHLIRRDYAATVVANGDGMNKGLIVNGVGLTMLTTTTKVMAHMPLAFLNRPPRNALVICFGMGTTHRSLMTWNIPVTAVELLPSVPALYGFYHSDGPELLRKPNSHLVIDDGRLFLEKSKQQFDVITIDPPPPISAAGVSFLYTREFYETLKPRLTADGILQQWISGADIQERVAMGKAIRESFPYVRAFVSNFRGVIGVHLLASMRPIPNMTAAELARRLPLAAQADLVEWMPGATAQGVFQYLLANETNVDEALAKFPNIPALRDDRPINEYYLLRTDLLPKRWSDKLFGFAN